MVPEKKKVQKMSIEQKSESEDESADEAESEAKESLGMRLSLQMRPTNRKQAAGRKNGN